MIIGGQEQAYDEIFTLIKTALDTVPGLSVIWQDQLDNVDALSPVVIVSLQHVMGRQASFAGDDGKRKWTNDGIIYIQARCPAKGGLTTINSLTTMCIESIRGKTTPGGVWFRNVVGKEEAPKDGNSRAITTGEFTYQEIS